MVGRPVLAVALSFIGGVALGAWLPQEPSAWGWAAVVGLLVWTALLAAGRLTASARVALVTFGMIGIFRLQGDLAPLYAGGDALEEGDAVATGRLGRPAELRDGELILHLEQVRLRRGRETALLSLPLQIIVPGSGPAYALGDLVMARGRLRSIRGDRNLGWFPGPLATAGRRYAARLIVGSAAWIGITGNQPGRGPGARVLRWRAAADAFWKDRPGAAGQILNSLTTGERAGIPAEIQQTFLRSGLTHLLAISGMNVGFLAALVFLSLKHGLALIEALALRFPVQPLAALLTLPSLWFFMLFSGSQIPVGRAVISSAAGLAAVLLWRRAHPADAWALAAVAIIAADPRALFSPSFQLSFGAVGALMLVTSRVRSQPAAPGQPAAGWCRRLYRGARTLFVVSLAASAVTAPLVAFHFQQVSLVGPLANLIAVPFTGCVVLPAGWLALAAAALWPAAGAVVATAALWSARVLMAIAAWFALPSWAIVETARPPLLLTFSLLALACLALPNPTLRLRSWCVAGCTAAALAAGAWSIARHRQELLVAVLDVGQGLAVAVLLPAGGALLYDAGPRWRDYDAGERVVVPALRRLGVSRVETLAISHRHPDHEGGAAAVNKALPVDILWHFGPGGGALMRGERRSLHGGVVATILNPAARASQRPTSLDENDRSLALLLTLGETGVVLAGDAGPLPAAEFAAVFPRMPRHLVLQVPHHGGSVDACRTLAVALRPEVSAISVGRNTYGHPRAGAVAALSGVGRVVRTDRDGAIFMRSDGSGWAVRTWREYANGRTWPERVRWLVAGW
jgi:competence protein ComEC